MYRDVRTLFGKVLWTEGRSNRSKRQSWRSGSEKFGRREWWGYFTEIKDHCVGHLRRTKPNSKLERLYKSRHGEREGVLWSPLKQCMVWWKDRWERGRLKPLRKKTVQELTITGSPKTGILKEKKKCNL